MDLFWNEQNQANIEKAMQPEKIDRVPYRFSYQLDYLSRMMDI